MFAKLLAHVQARRRRRALLRLERATGVIRHAKVRLYGKGHDLLIEDLSNPDVRIVRLSPRDAYVLGRGLVKRSRKAGA